MMKELAALALVILPLGMTMVELLAASDAPAPEKRDQGGDVHSSAGGEATEAPTADRAGARPRGNEPPYAPGALAGDAVPGKPA